MVPLKSTLLAVSILISACAQKFDPVEHGRIVDVKHRVIQAQIQGHCADPVRAKYTAELVNSDAAWMVFYSQHIPKNESMQRMSTELKSITQEFAQRYQQPTPPSKIYCELKLKNIASVVDVIQQTNARRSR